MYIHNEHPTKDAYNIDYNEDQGIGVPEFCPFCSEEVDDIEINDLEDLDEDEENEFLERED